MATARRRPTWAIALAVGLAALAAPLVAKPEWVATSCGALAIVAGLGLLASVLRRRAIELTLGALGALLLFGGGVYHLAAHRGRSAGPRAALIAEGFSNVTLSPEAGGTLSFEAERNGEHCEGEILPDGRRAIRCTSAEPLADVEHDCAEDRLERCAEAAARVRADAPVDWPRATRSSARACEGGLVSECLYLGMAEELGGRGVPRDLAAAAAHYERACDAGVEAACTRPRALPDAR